MTDKQMLRFSSMFPIAIVFLVAALSAMSLILAGDASVIGVALLPALAAMISSTFLSVLVEKQSDRITALEKQIADSQRNNDQQ